MSVPSAMTASCKRSGAVSNARGTSLWVQSCGRHYLPILVLDGDCFEIRRDLHDAHLLEYAEIVGHPHILLSACLTKSFSRVGAARTHLPDCQQLVRFQRLQQFA
jgi:hypothetical protein